jgi:hypothetical protein
MFALWLLPVRDYNAMQALEGKIVSACTGMPLILELAGGRLRYKRDIEQWQVRTTSILCL